MKVELSKPMKVILVEFIVCSMLTLLFLSLPFFRGGYTLWPFLCTWLLSHLGPLLALGVSLFHISELTLPANGVIANLSDMILGIGMLVLPVITIWMYLVRPSKTSLFLSFIGMIIWFFMGLSFVFSM